MIKETMAYLSQYDPEVGATIENEYHREQFRGYLRRGYENLARAAYGHEAVGLDD